MISPYAMHQCLVSQGRDKLAKVATAASEKPIEKRAVELVRRPLVMLDVANARPSQALELLREALPQDASRRKQWIADARIAAVLGSCPLSHRGFVSGEHLLRRHRPSLCYWRVARCSQLVRLCRRFLWEQFLGLPTDCGGHHLLVTHFSLHWYLCQLSWLFAERLSGLGC